jgi:hypothetical protein
MHAPRRTIAWITVLGLVIVLAVIQQRRDDAPAVDLIEGALPPTDDAGETQRAAPAAAPAISRTPPRPPTSESEVSGTCARILGDAAAFAEMEGRAASPVRPSEWSNDRIRSELKNLQRSLAGSTDPEIVLTTYALDQASTAESNDPPDYTSLLELGLGAAGSDSPLVAWNALKACALAEEYCPFPHLEQRLLEIDRDNAEAWALVATIRHRRGDVAGALAAMQGAARASSSTLYWSETLTLIERSLAAQTALPFAVRLVPAYDMTTAMGLPVQSRMCQVESATSRAWAEACLALGTLRTETDNTILERGLGYSMREQALTALGDLEAAAEVAEEHALFSDERSAGGSDWSMWRARLQGALISNPGKWHAFIGAIQEFGEMEGLRQFLRREVPPLLERGGLLEREGARECAAQLFEPATALRVLSATFRDYPVEEYPIGVGDQLQILVSNQGTGTWRRIGPDGTITMRRISGLVVVGKTTGQLEREIATILSARFPAAPSPEVSVYLISPPSPEERRNEFDKALRDAGSR